jgi:iron complex transport system substrate-binding protein
MRRLVLVLALASLAAGVLAAAGEPVRVATLLPYVADALEEIHGPARVVASVRRTVGQAPRAGIADLGSSHAPNLEQIVASRAQVVVGDERFHRVLQPKIEAVGAEVLLIRGDSVEDTFRGLLAVGERAGDGPRMAARVEKARGELAALTRGRPVDTLALFGAPGSFLAITPRTWLGDLLARLRFRNVATAGLGTESQPGYLELNDEVMASLRPELVLLVTHGNPREIEQAFARLTREKSAWRGLAGARYGVHVLDPGLFASNPGLRMADAARSLTGLVKGAR